MGAHIFLSSYCWVKEVTRINTARKLFTDLNFSFDLRRIFFLLLTHVCQNLTTLHNCIIFKVNCKNRHQLKPFRSFQSFLRQVSLELERQGYKGLNLVNSRVKATQALKFLQKIHYK